MILNLGASHNSPYRAGRQDDGDVIVQIRSGSGAWFSKTSQALLDLRSVDGSLILGGDAIYVTPGDGIVRLPWSGDLWVYAPTASVETIFGVILFMGCTQ